MANSHRSTSLTRNNYDSRRRSLGLYDLKYSAYNPNTYSYSPNNSNLLGFYKTPSILSRYKTSSLSRYSGYGSNPLKTDTSRLVHSPTTSSNVARYSSRRSRRETIHGISSKDSSTHSTNQLGISSKSLSLTSLNSEGYISGSDTNCKTRLFDVDIRNENGEIDYKKLYEQAIAENTKLKDKLRKSNEDLRATKETLEKIDLVTSKNSLSELEKRERRAMERKLSEMEEELKQLQKLKAENERLKADNRSLTRVINKLTTSTKK